ELLKNLASISSSDVNQMIKGYYVGLIEGLISPVTDLWGIAVLGERMQNLMKDLLASAFKNRKDVTQEFAELVEEAKHVGESAGNLLSWIREHPQEALTAILSAPDALSEFAERKAYELGKAGASSIVASMEAPFKKPGEEKKEEKEESDWINAPAAAV